MTRFHTTSVHVPSRRQQLGVTLIELLVTLGILTILLTLAVPSFTDFFVSNRIVSTTNDFMATLNYARSEAIKRGTWVSVCKSASGTSCGGNWSDGWIVFVDADDGDGTLDTTVDTEEILRVQDSLPSSISLNSNGTNFANRITFDHRGTANNFGSFLICANATADSKSRQIFVQHRKLRSGANTTNPLSCS